MNKQGQPKHQSIFNIALVLVMAFCFFVDAGGRDVNWPPWTYLTVVFTCILAFRLVWADRLPWAIVLLFMWILESGFMWMEWRPLTDHMPPEQRTTIIALAGTSLAQFLLLTITFYTQWPKIRKPLALALFWGGFLHSAILLLDQLAPALFPHLPPQLFLTRGLLGNRSIGASFSAVWWYFVLYLTIHADDREPTLETSESFTKYMFYAAWVAPLAVLASVSSISFAAMTVGSMAVLVACIPRLTPYWARITYGLLAIGVPLTWLTGHVIDPDWGHHINRQDAWAMFYNYYDTHHMLVFGSGPGTFKWYGPLAQATYNWSAGDIWLWAHSDWLQIWCELGAIGLALSLCSAFAIAMRAWKRPLLFGAVVTYFVIMGGNYPLHIAMTALLGLWIAFESLWGDECS